MSEQQTTEEQHLADDPGATDAVDTATTSPEGTAAADAAVPAAPPAADPAPADPGPAPVVEDTGPADGTGGVDVADVRGPEGGTAVEREGPTDASDADDAEVGAAGAADTGVEPAGTDAAQPAPDPVTAPEADGGLDGATARTADPASSIPPAGAPAPRPGPRPVPPPGRPAVRPGPPRPAARPAAVVPPVAASPVPVASADPARWGWADPDGTVHVRTADGDRVVGSWQAGTPEEGLAHFARRFDDLLTETELVAARLDVGTGDPKQTLAAVRVLRTGLEEATVVGDVAGLIERLDGLAARAEEAVGAARSARDAQRAAAVARKEELAAEAEALAAEATQWKQAGDRFTAILDEWRSIRGIDRKTDEALWKRFSRAREAFNRRRGSHFADLDRQRGVARAQKEDLALEAEKLADSDDWGATAARFRDLMTEWKGAGRAPKDADDALWQRFRAAQDAFFARRSAVFAERDAEFAANGAAKRALLAEAEKIDVSDPAAARNALRAIQERWEEIGKVPRDDVRPLEARLRAVEEKVREAGDRQWRRTDPEAEARVAQFRDRVAQFEAQAEKAEAAGDRRRAEQARSQATQWREWLAAAEQAVQSR